MIKQLLAAAIAVAFSCAAPAQTAFSPAMVQQIQELIDGGREPTNLDPSKLPGGRTAFYPPRKSGVWVDQFALFTNTFKQVLGHNGGDIEHATEVTMLLLADWREPGPAFWCYRGGQWHVISQAELGLDAPPLQQLDASESVCEFLGCFDFTYPNSTDPCTSDWYFVAGAGTDGLCECFYPICEDLQGCVVSADVYITVPAGHCLCRVRPWTGTIVCGPNNFTETIGISSPQQCGTYTRFDYRLQTGGCDGPGTFCHIGFALACYLCEGLSCEPLEPI